MGTLYIISTPLGNLGDITLRALEILKLVDLVACEDTRQTIKLLNHYQIAKPLVSYFQHSKLSKIEYLAEQLAGGKNIALVTDAGTPGISDPGGKLIEGLLRLLPSDEGRLGWAVQALRAFRLERGDEKKTNTTLSQSTSQLSGRGESMKIVPIPGPCAAIAALSVCGFPADRFVFMGFPPHKKGRETYFKKIAAAEETVVFYESTHRILKRLGQLAGVAPGRQIMVAREITKMFESIYRGTAEEILEILKSDKNNQKGEFVIVINKG